MWKRRISSFQRLSSKDLELLSAPKCQRLVDPHHINELYLFQKTHFKKYGKFFFTLPIVIAEFRKERYVIDGQHRLECAARLRKDGSKVDLTAAVIEVESLTELEEKYEALNKNKPLSNGPLWEWKNFLKPIEKHFRKRYGPYIKGTQAPQAPHFNADQLCDYLTTYKIGRKLQYDPAKFVGASETLNTYYCNTYQVSVEPFFRNNVSRQIRKAFHKKTKNGKSTPTCLLGVYRRFEWVIRVLHHLETDTPFQNMDHFPLERCCKKIDQQLRKRVWTRHFQSTEGVCFVSACHTPIDSFSFVCGHVVSRFRGGQTVLTNLRPICSACNGDMGAENLNEYSERMKKSIFVGKDGMEQPPGL